MHSTNGPDPALAAFTAIDAGDADLFVTGSAGIGRWADQRGYVVRTAQQNGLTIYEIWPGDAGPEDPIVRLDVSCAASMAFC